MTEVDLAYAIRVLRDEARAVEGLVSRIDDETFGEAVREILVCEGRVVVIGLGKTWLVGQKVSATLASTGTPSHVLHAAEALHGDLGRVVKGDLALILSNSGRTRESVELLGPLKQIGVPVIVITGDLESPLGKDADLVLHIGKLTEAGDLGLAPTTSTTAMMALGDALALTVLKHRKFSAEEFAFFHPGGSLGRRLLKVEEVMRTGERHPIIRQDQPVLEALLRITNARAGAITVVDGDGQLVGIFTDGDLRRRIVKQVPIETMVVRDAMTRDPTRIQAGELASAAIGILQNQKHNQVPVIDADGRPVGIVDIQDIAGTL